MSSFCVIATFSFVNWTSLLNDLTNINICAKNSGMAMDEPIPFCYAWNFNEHII